MIKDETTEVIADCVAPLNAENIESLEKLYQRVTAEVDAEFIK